MSLANFQALALNADERCYLEFKITRTGADNTGLISFNAIAIVYTYNPSAIFGHGSFTNWGILGEIPLFLKAVIQSIVVKSGGFDRFLSRQRVLPGASARSRGDGGDREHDDDDRDAPEGAVAEVSATRRRRVGAGRRRRHGG